MLIFLNVKNLCKTKLCTLGYCVNTRNNDPGAKSCDYQLSLVDESSQNYLTWKDCDSECDLSACRPQRPKGA